MFVCICNAVSDREVRAQAELGVTTLDELRLRTGCSDCCGQCADEAEEILRSVHAAEGSGPATATSPAKGRQSPVLPVMTPQHA